jgi:hypothetical protein
MEDKKRHPLRFKIVRTNPDKLNYEFTNDIIITHDRENFYIQFGQVAPPQISGQDDLENMAVLGAIESPAVARLVMDKAYIPTLIRALQDNLYKHNTIHQPKNPETDSIEGQDFEADEFRLDGGE